MGENAWTSLGENTWPIIARKMTRDPFSDCWTRRLSRHAAELSRFGGRFASLAPAEWGVVLVSWGPSMGRNPMAMKYRHVLAFAVRGLKGDSIDQDRVLVDATDHSIKAILTRDLDDQLYAIDRGLALSTLMLKGLFSERLEGDRTRLIEEEVSGIRARTDDRLGDSLALSITIEGEVEPDLSNTKKETSEFVVILDAVDKKQIREKDVGIVSSIVASLPLSLGRSEPIEKLRDGIYLVDSEGKIWYSKSVSAGPAKVRLSTPLSPELTERASFFASSLLQAPQLFSTVRLYIQSIDEESDRLRAFMAAWAGLEILINKSFSKYDKRFMESIKSTDPSYAVEAYLARISDVMSGKYRLMDRFAIVSHFLAKETSEADLASLKNIKTIRDGLVHGLDYEEHHLPVEATQELLLRYLEAHLRDIVN